MQTLLTEHYHYEGTGYGAVEEAFSNWKSIYNMSVSLNRTCLSSPPWTL